MRPDSRVLENAQEIENGRGEDVGMLASTRRGDGNGDREWRWWKMVAIAKDGGDGGGKR